jgi:two-component system, NtrC family, response regulator HydG
MYRLSILIVHRDRVDPTVLTSMLKSLGHIIEKATDDRLAVKLIEQKSIDLVLGEVDPLDTRALELLAYIRRNHRGIPVILLFPRPHAERAREALRSGAEGVLNYPVSAAELRAAVLQGLESRDARASRSVSPAPPPTRSPEPALVPFLSLCTADQLDFEPVFTPDRAPTVGPSAHLLRPSALTFNSPVVNGSAIQATPSSLVRHAELLAQEIGLLGTDPSWRRIIALTRTVAATQIPILIVGEPGTGKSLLARLIHLLGPDPDRPFVTLESLAIADGLPSHVSPHTPGSAGGNAPRLWADKLAEARGGTLFLDEVAALPLEFQLHLFRELLFRDDRPGAGHHLPEAHARFVVSTGGNLRALVDGGRFHQELYHRLSVISLLLPPLRHRGADVELLAESFRARYASESQRTARGFTGDGLEVLRKHDWPGNVRELETTIQRAVALCKGPRISSKILEPILCSSRRARAADGAEPRPHLKVGVRTLKEALEEPEKRIIIQALQSFNWNRQKTAGALNIDRATLYKKIKKYSLLSDEPTWATSEADETSGRGNKSGIRLGTRLS